MFALTEFSLSIAVEYLSQFLCRYFPYCFLLWHCWYAVAQTTYLYAWSTHNSISHFVAGRCEKYGLAVHLLENLCVYKERVRGETETERQ